MTTQYLFNRAWNVTLGFSGGTGLSYTSLHTTFDITRDSFGGVSNKAKIELYNLSQASRKIFQRKGLQITLQAGYQGLSKTILIADVTRMVTKRKGSDIVTEFECGEGEKIISTLSFNKSYPPGTTYVQIIQDICSALQNVGIGIGIVIGIPAQKYNKGVSFATSVASVLTTLLNKTNLEWKIFNNTLQILPRNADNGESVIVLSKSSGLIGVPSLKNDGVEFAALLNPNIVPGSAVQLICGEVAGQLDVYNPSQSSISGYYRVRNAHYEGDSHGEKWFVRCEGDRIIPKVLPFNQGANLQTAVISG